MSTDREDRWGSDEPYDDRPRPPSRAEVKSKVMGPAIGLIICAVLQLLGSVYNVLTINQLPAQFEAQRKQIDADPKMGEDQKKQMKDFLQTYENIVTPGMPVGIGLGAIGGVVILIGGIKMMNLSSLGWARAASILVLIPCFACCLIGIPIGIWSLTTLKKPEVRAAFDGSARPREDSDDVSEIDRG